MGYNNGSYTVRILKIWVTTMAITQWEFWIYGIQQRQWQSEHFGYMSLIQQWQSHNEHFGYMGYNNGNHTVRNLNMWVTTMAITQIWIYGLQHWQSHSEHFEYMDYNNGNHCEHFGYMMYKSYINGNNSLRFLDFLTYQTKLSWK